MQTRINVFYGVIYGFKEIKIVFFRVSSVNYNIYDYFYHKSNIFGGLDKQELY